MTENTGRKEAFVNVLAQARLIELAILYRALGSTPVSHEI